MNESFEEIRCLECGDFYNRDFMNGNLCLSCRGDGDNEENDIN
ncbi:hypothetical protein [Planococcus kocurii]|nr:hypothetical protein [Planococcus kocurii]